LILKLKIFGKLPLELFGENCIQVVFRKERLMAINGAARLDSKQVIVGGDILG